MSRRERGPPIAHRGDACPCPGVVAKHRVVRARCRTHELGARGGLHPLGIEAGNPEDLPREVEPARLARVRGVIDAGSGIRVEQFHDLAGEIPGPGRLAELVGHHAHGVMARREAQHGFREIGATGAVEPGGANDVGAIRIRGEGEPFALGLGAAVGGDRVERCRLVVGFGRRTVEDVVG